MSRGQKTNRVETCLPNHEEVFGMIGINGELIQKWYNFILRTRHKLGFEHKGSVCFDRVLGVLVMLRMNLTWDLSEALLRALGLGDVSARTLERVLEEFSSTIASCNTEGITKGCETGKRFDHMDERWPYVTAISDGSPVPCRFLGEKYVNLSGKDAEKNYSNKYVINCMKFELWTTVTGIPLAFRGPICGSAHDMKFVHSAAGAPFPHYDEELFLMDSGYFGTAHALLPYKKPEEDGNKLLGYVSRYEGKLVLSAMVDENEPHRQLLTRTYWNRVHAQVRSRVERRFAHMLKWRFLSMCGFDAKHLHCALTIIVSLECYVGMHSPVSYPEHKKRTSPLPNWLPCSCQYTGKTGGAAYRTLYKKALSQRQTFSYRLFLANHLPPRRLPRNRGKAPDGLVPDHLEFITLHNPNPDRTEIESDEDEDETQEAGTDDESSDDSELDEILD